MNILNRDHAREMLAKAGITTETITPSGLRIIHSYIDQRMIESGLMKGSFRMNDICKKDPKFLKCHSFNFDDREAISFNRDGFIGFAGWAGDKNVRPILDGIGDYLDWRSAWLSADGIHNAGGRYDQDCY